MALTTIRWRRWLAGAACLLALYALAGFWLLPLLVRHQLPAFGHDRLERQLSVGEVRFNPFSLRLEAQQLHLAEADGAALLDVGKLAAQLEWRSIFQRAWRFSDIRISAPQARLAIAADGRFNLAELIATFQRGPKEPPSGMPRLIVGQFTLEQGRIDLHDARVGYDDRFAPIDFSVANFSTLPDQTGNSSFSAESARGGKLRWKGEATMNPIRGSGELVLENVHLPDLAVYLKSFSHATVACGKLNLGLPYRFAYGDGKLDASVAGARLTLRDLSLARPGKAGAANAVFTSLTRVDVKDIGADLRRREATVGLLQIDGGRVDLHRDANGEIDLANLGVKTDSAANGAKNGKQAKANAATANDWKLILKQLAIDKLAVRAIDDTVSPAAALSVANASLHLQLHARQTVAAFGLTLADAALSLADVTLTSGTQTPLKLAQLSFTEGTLDLAGRKASVGRLYAEGAQMQLTRDRAGRLDLMARLPKAGAASKSAAPPVAVSAPSTPWNASAGTIELSKAGAVIDDQASGIKLHVLDLGMKLAGASSDLAQPVRFDGGLRLGEGGQLAVQGSVVPASGALQADLNIRQLALAPLQPLLSQYLKLTLAGGTVSAKGRLTAAGSNAVNQAGGSATNAASMPTSSATAGAASPKGRDRFERASLRYVGAIDIADLVLNEQNGVRFAAWKSVSADQLSASVAPNFLQIPLLRVVEPNATLIIENDRSFNASRLLVRPPAAPQQTAGVATAPTAARGPAVAVVPTAATLATADPFPVRIQRMRFENAKLDFTDLSLRPQFGAKIVELNGAVTGLSSARDARSQIMLDGRVDAFGLARIRGDLNPFAPRDNTDINVVFKNIDMTSVSPYSMKFAGYRIAEGKISLDLQYKVRASQLDGANQIVIDNLVLGERVDSPDALRLPLELAIAILKDSNGRIDLGLPVSGNLNDPQFSYGAVVWKAIGNLLTKIVTSPFRALGGMFGVDADRMSAIDFDPGSDRLLPPEREKLKQIAQMLAKRDQLKLTIPGQYSERDDGAALRARALRDEIARRAGVKLNPGEDLGSIDTRDHATRSALRELYAERFGTAELDKQKKLAEENAAPAPRPEGAKQPAVAGAKAAAEPAALPLWQRVGKLVQGEPQVADAGRFYRTLQERLEQSQTLPADALSRLGAQRASAIAAALHDAGVDPARAVAAAPAKINSDSGKPISVTLTLAAR